MKWPFGSKTEAAGEVPVTFKGQPVRCPRCKEVIRVRLAWDAVHPSLPPTNGVSARCLVCDMAMDADGVWFDPAARKKAEALLEKSLVAFGHIKESIDSSIEEASRPPLKFAPLASGPRDEGAVWKKLEILDSILAVIAKEINELRSGK